MRSSYAALILVPVLVLTIFISSCREESTDTLTCREVMENLEYGIDIKVRGTVSQLGEILSPSFILTSGGAEMVVWYDSMVEDDGTERPAVSVEGIKNGDQVIVTGELKLVGTHKSLNDFWASKIEK